MKRILFYCQHLLGVGHLTRSLALCEALAGPYQIDLLQGGPDIGLGLEHPRFRRVQLPPLLMREDDSSLYDPRGLRPVEEILAARRRAIARELREGSYGHLIIELFPFGRRKFRHEILWLIAQVRTADPGVSVHCSLRDIMIEREACRDAQTLEFLRRDFDSVLVHSDPRFIRLEDSFEQASAISPMLHYTGFVARKSSAPAGARRRDRILVSLGGGLVGGQLARAAAEAARRLPAYEFHFALGPNTPRLVRGALGDAALRRPNIKLVGFLTDFQSALRESRLSLSLAGYNTVMDLLRTRTPAIVLPYDANREQMMRARRFEQAGLLTVAGEHDLRPDRLEALIMRELSRPYPEVDVDLEGAQGAAQRLMAQDAMTVGRAT